MAHLPQNSVCQRLVSCRLRNALTNDSTSSPSTRFFITSSMRAPICPPIFMLFTAPAAGFAAPKEGVAATQRTAERMIEKVLIFMSCVMVDMR